MSQRIDDLSVCGIFFIRDHQQVAAVRIPFIDLESKSGDCNGDGTIDLKDVTAIRRYLAGGYGIEIE